MIIKGGSRGGPEQLAKHLLRADTNEMVEIIESLWVKQELVETLRDWQILSEGTQGKKGLYHVNIDPAEDYVMSMEQWQRSVDVLEKELGFEGQPRVVVMHQKHGRQHVHVVWARTDIDTMTLKEDSFNYVKHERASKKLELEFGHEPVPGKHAKRDRKKQPEFPRAEYDHAEWQQGERTSVDPEQRKDEITALRQASDSAEAFKAGLEDQGYILARGDKVPFVIVDQAGETYSLAKQLRDMTTPQLRKFLKDIDPQSLPTAAQAVEIQEQRRGQRQHDNAVQAEPAAEPSAADRATQGLTPAEVQALRQASADRQAREATEMRARHEAEYGRTRDVLDRDNAESLRHVDARQKAERGQFERENAQPEGLDRIIADIRRWLNPKLAEQRDAERRDRQREMEGRLQKEREERERQLQQTRALELENLAERHAQQRRDHATRSEEDLDRHIREQEAARQLESETRERALQREQERTRDGPEHPPPLTR
jgi:hypothetical protein